MQVATASQNLVPILGAGVFPSLTTYTKAGDTIALPITETDNPDICATVICISFRASAQVSFVQLTVTHHFDLQ
jgi:hypothetical protein